MQVVGNGIIFVVMVYSKPKAYFGHRVESWSIAVIPTLISLPLYT
jgi:hypothetical protein